MSVELQRALANRILKIRFRIRRNIVCHQCKRKLGAYYGENASLVTETGESVEAKIYCDECTAKKQLQERQTKLGEVLTREADNQ